MSAERSPKPSDDERAEHFLATYQSKYSEAIDSARHAAETTQTEAWRSNYSNAVKLHVAERTEQMKSLAYLVESMKHRDLQEEEEKELGDVKKSLVDERIRHTAWLSRSVYLYKQAVDGAQELITAALRDAKQTEDESGLTAHGLLESVRKLIDSWPKATWDDEAGVASVN